MNSWNHICEIGIGLAEAARLFFRHIGLILFDVNGRRVSYACRVGKKYAEQHALEGKFKDLGESFVAAIDIDNGNYTTGDSVFEARRAFRMKYGIPGNLYFHTQGIPTSIREY